MTVKNVTKAIAGEIKFDTGHASWAVSARAKNQKIAIRITQLIAENRELVVAKHVNRVERMVAAAFALWRAAFLADPEEKITGATRLAHVDRFLERLIVDNAINFQQDRSARNWTFRFYADVAEANLALLEGEAPKKYFSHLEVRLGKSGGIARIGD